MMPVKKRTYNTRRIKRDYSYNIEEITELFAVHNNTVRSWIRAGLKLIDKQRPHMVHGSDLIAYLNEKQTKRKHTCKHDELYCFKCRLPRPAWEGLIDIEIKTEKILQLIGICETCGTEVYRTGSVNKLPEYFKTFNVQRMQGRHIIESTHPTLMCYFERNYKS